MDRLSVQRILRVGSVPCSEKSNVEEPIHRQKNHAARLELLPRHQRFGSAAFCGILAYGTNGEFCFQVFPNTTICLRSQL